MHYKNICESRHIELSQSLLPPTCTHFPRGPLNKQNLPPNFKQMALLIAFFFWRKGRNKTKTQIKDLVRDYSNEVSTPHYLIPISSPWCLGDRDWSPQPTLHSLSQSGPSFFQALLSLFLHINPLHTSQIVPSLVPEHQFLCAFACIISSAWLSQTDSLHWQEAV